MKKIILILLSMAVFMPEARPQLVATGEDSYLVAQKSKKRNRRRTQRVRRNKRELVEALRLSKAGNYQEASKRLFSLSVSPRYKAERLQIKYILGLMLYQMKLYQLSAYQFISVIKKGKTKYLSQSLEKLSLAADVLGDDTLLNYAISKIKIKQYPRAHRDMLYFRVGEIQLRNKKYKNAIKNFSKVKYGSKYYSKAMYLRGLAYAETKQTRRALSTFRKLADSRAAKQVTDKVAVSAQMAIARTLYQGKKWDEAIEAYRQIPRDTPAWHETLFESSWAMLRSGRFRSALSNFQTLHSAYYENYYQPEPLLLRSIVYLYICKYDEMKKVLNLYNSIYKPVYKSISSYLRSGTSSKDYFTDVASIIKEYEDSETGEVKKDYPLPLIVARRLSGEGDFIRSRNYVSRLYIELQRMKELPGNWKNSAIGRYGERVIQRRVNRAMASSGRQVKRNLISMKNELLDLFEQEGFIRFEMINGKKEILKKRVAGKSLPAVQVDEKEGRDYYVQNGFQYWPYQGEAWLDELGNYHYVGTQSCQ